VLLGGLIASKMNLDIDLLVIVPLDDYKENGEAVLEQACKDLEGESVTCILKQGETVQIIKDQINQSDYSLMVFNKNRFDKNIYGMPSMQVFWKTHHIPILVTENVKPKIQNILLCTSGENEGLLKSGAEIAKAVQAKITLLHVAAGSVPTMYTGLDVFDESVPNILKTDTPFAKHLRHGVELFTDYDVPAEVKIRHGVPVDEIVRETQLENYDMLIIGPSRVKNGFRERLLGNLTAQLIDRVELPVMVIDSSLFGNE
jgi:nucleotide-binding universal stress UspA family protein